MIAKQLNWCKMHFQTFFFIQMLKSVHVIYECFLFLQQLCIGVVVEIGFGFVSHSSSGVRVGVGLTHLQKLGSE